MYSYLKIYTMCYHHQYRQINHEQMVLGARLAQKEIGSASAAPGVIPAYPNRENSLDDQVSFVREATSLGVEAIMMANNAGEIIENYTLAAANKVRGSSFFSEFACEMLF